MSESEEPLCQTRLLDPVHIAIAANLRMRATIESPTYPHQEIIRRGCLGVHIGRNEQYFSFSLANPLLLAEFSSCVVYYGGVFFLSREFPELAPCRIA